MESIYIPPTEPSSLELMWKSDGGSSHSSLTFPKSSPVLAGDFLIFASDNGIIWCLKKEDGTKVWSFTIETTDTGPKKITSTPLVHNERVYFGAYDGNVYCLDLRTGKQIWVYYEADWIGSSPCIDTEENTLFIGLEYGRIAQQGGVVAIDAASGLKKWEYVVSDTTVHGTPMFDPFSKLVFCGDDMGVLRALNAQSGELVWSVHTGGPLKSSSTVHTKRGLVYVGSFDGFLYNIDIHTGEIKNRFRTKNIIFSKPLVVDDRVYIGSTDKCMYALDAATLEMKWMYQTRGKIFSTPVQIGNMIIFGSNDGLVYCTDVQFGLLTDHIAVGDAVVSSFAYDEAAGALYLATTNNTVCCYVSPKLV